MTNLIDKIFDQIQEFLNLDPRNFEKSEKLSKEIIQNAERLEKTIGEKDTKKKLLKILPSLKTYSSKLSKDIVNSKETSLETEWTQLALKDLFRLKDEIMALQEVLQDNESRIRSNLDKERYGFDSQNLVRRLKTDSSIDESTRSKLSKLFEEMTEEEMREEIEKNEERLSRISKWFLIRKEIKNASR